MKQGYQKTANGGEMNLFTSDPVITYDHMNESYDTVQPLQRRQQKSTKGFWFLLEELSIATLLGLCVWASF
jgi:hypothetical protein